MDISILLWIIVGAIALSVFLSAKFKINIGIIGMGFAFIIGVFMLGMSTKEVAANFPTSLFIQMIFIPAFFSFAIENKTLPAVAQKVLYSFRNKPNLIPFVFLLIGLLLGVGGAGGPTGNVVLTVMTFSIGIAMGLSPWLCIVISVYGANIGGWTPWAGNGVSAGRITEGWLPGLGNTACWTMSFGWAIFTLILFFAVWFLTKGYRLKATTMEAPKDLTGVQKKTLALICLYIALLLIPAILKMAIPSPFTKKIASWAQPEIVACLLINLSFFLKLSDPKTLVAKGMNWSTALMVGGICTLLNIATSHGVTEYLGAVLSESVNPFWMPLLLCLLGGFLSCFAGAMGTVYPLLGAVAVPYAAAAGVNPMPLLCAVMMGASASAVSPLSAGGAIMIAAVPDEKIRDTLFYKNLALAGIGVVVAAFVSMFLIPLVC